MGQGLRVQLIKVEDLPVIEQVLGVTEARYYAGCLKKRGPIFGAWRDETFAGALWVSLERADEWMVRLLLRKVPVLHRLRVRADMRRQRVGTKLIGAAEAFVRQAGQSKVAVGVNVNPRGVERFYQMLGYKEWAFGRVKTFSESYADDGRIVVAREHCRMFVKPLPASQ